MEQTRRAGVLLKGKVVTLLDCWPENRRSAGKLAGPKWEA